MSSLHFERLTANYEILIQIYKMLEFEDQLRLAQVNDVFKRVFESFIWKEDYRTLAIYSNNNEFIIANESGVNRLYLTLEATTEFMRLYAETVRALIADSLALPEIGLLTNIISLTYRFNRLRLEDMQFVVDNFPKLKGLYLFGSGNARIFDSLNNGRSLNLNILYNNKHLKQFCLLASGGMNTISYSHLHDLIIKLNLESLKLDCTLEPSDDINDMHLKIAINRWPLREFHINTSFDSVSWSSMRPSFLLHFENLLYLVISINDVVTDDILSVLSESCQKLVTLSIRYTSFKIKTFSIPPQVSELALSSCRGLTRANLKQLLTQNKLIKFKSGLTFYQGEFEDFHISPFITKLNVDDIDMCKFRKAYENNIHLKELTWHHAGGCINYRRIASNIPLASCSNLEILDMRGTLLDLDTLVQLQHLRSVVLNFASLPMQWSYVTTLLKHTSLRELAIQIFSNTSYRHMAADAPNAGFSTQLGSLKVHVMIFELAVNFWLDLLNHNANLTLVICNFTRKKLPSLLDVIKNSKFPKSLKIIDVFGFYLNCNDLRTNFDDTIKNVNNYGDMYENLNRIILCRKK